MGEALNAAGCGMYALEQGVKVQGHARVSSFAASICAGNHDFSIEHKLARGERPQRGRDFREIARERLSGLGLQHYFVAAAESQTAEAVPLGLIEPFRASRDFFHGLGVSGRIWRLERKIDFRKRLL